MVYWTSSAYVVTKCKGTYYVKCILNDSVVGLYHADGVGTSYQANEFFTGVMK